MRVVGIGGGSGLSTVGPGFLVPSVPLFTAIVTAADSGGDSAIYRRRDGFLAPGDIRHVMWSLAKNEHKALLKDRLNGISTGNAVLIEHIRRFGVEAGIEAMGKAVLKPGCRVIPVTAQSVILRAILESGRRIAYEHKIGDRSDYKDRIRGVFLDPPAKPAEGVIESILEADLIVLGPGSLFTSIMPNLMVQGVSEALSQTKAKVVLITSLVTDRETYGYNAANIAGVVAERLRRQRLDAVFCNDSSKISQEMLGKYLSEQGSEALEYDPDDEDQAGMMATYAKEVIVGNFLSTKHPLLARHSKKVVKAIFDWYSSAVAHERALVPAEETCQTV
jgi:uncharacterized cofD-like protein